MDYEKAVLAVLNEIDAKIGEPLAADELARAAGYSTYHFCRLFAEKTGMPLMRYVLKRKLEHARIDLARGERVLDVAMRYGFDTHAGFTKAFKRGFGYPPSLSRLRACPV